MIGKLDPDEDIMDDSIIAQRKSTALMKALHDNIKNTIAKLGWDCYDNVVVEIAGSSVYMIDASDLLPEIKQHDAMTVYSCAPRHPIDR